MHFLDLNQYVKVVTYIQSIYLWSMLCVISVGDRFDYASIRTNQLVISWIISSSTASIQTSLSVSLSVTVEELSGPRVAS